MIPAKDPRDVVIGLLGGTFAVLLVALAFVSLSAHGGSEGSGPAAGVSYSELAAQMNAPELTGQCAFDNEGDILICYVDAVWKNSTPDQQRQFALWMADRWATMTGSPHAGVFFGTGRGQLFGMAIAHRKDTGEPWYREVNVDFNSSCSLDAIERQFLAGPGA